MIKKLIAFDIDGTLLDNATQFVDACKRMFPRFNEKTGMSLRADEHRIIGAAGLPPQEIFTHIMPGVDMEYCTLMLSLFMEELEAGLRSGAAELFADVSRTLKRLHAGGYALVIASNGVRSYIETVLNHFDIAQYFSLPVIVVENDIKTKNDILAAYIVRENPDFTIMVGDRYTDKLAARACSAPFIACAFGHADISEIQGEHHVVSDFSQIYDMILRIERELGFE